MLTIDFYSMSKDNDPVIEGTVLISEDKGIQIAAGDEIFQEMVQNELEKGLRAFPLVKDRRRILHPSDGEMFVKRVEMKFSGSRFWAKRRD